MNVWEGKVLRSGMAAHFAVPIYTRLNWSQVSSYVHEKSQVLLAEPKPFNSPLLKDYSNLQVKLEEHGKLSNIIIFIDVHLWINKKKITTEDRDKIARRNKGARSFVKFYISYQAQL